MITGTSLVMHQRGDMQSGRKKTQVKCLVFLVSACQTANFSKGIICHKEWSRKVQLLWSQCAEG